MTKFKELKESLIRLKKVLYLLQMSKAFKIILGFDQVKKN